MAICIQHTPQTVTAHGSCGTPNPPAIRRPRRPSRELCTAARAWPYQNLQGSADRLWRTNRPPLRRRRRRRRRSCKRRAGGAAEWGTAAAARAASATAGRRARGAVGFFDCLLPAGGHLLALPCVWVPAERPRSPPRFACPLRPLRARRPAIPRDPCLPVRVGAAGPRAPPGVSDTV